MINRVNVGGSMIYPGDDTSMYQSWEPDQRYLVASKPTDYGVMPENLTIQLSYSSETLNYTAPDDVYKTRRSMDDNRFTNLGYNLMWSFPVD